MVVVVTRVPHPVGTLGWGQWGSWNPQGGDSMPPQTGNNMSAPRWGAPCLPETEVLGLWGSQCPQGQGCGDTKGPGIPRDWPVEAPVVPVSPQAVSIPKDKYTKTHLANALRHMV